MAHYEQLRRDATGSPAPREGLGLALFLQRGMKAWMQAWSDCSSNVEPGTRNDAGIGNTMPAGMQSQITSLLAGMILSLQPQEAS